MSSGDASLEDAVRAWLDEEKNYHGEKIGEGDFMSWGHYSKFQPPVFPLSSYTSSPSILASSLFCGSFYGIFIPPTVTLNKHL